MEGIVKLHDRCLDHECDIEQVVAQLEIRRLRAFNNADVELYKAIIPVLDAITYEVERYKEFLLGFLANEVADNLAKGRQV